MDEKALLEWKEAHADVYSKFKQDLEEQLLKPYHQTILDLGDGNAESLQSVIANLYAVSSKDGFDIEKLYTKAVESGDVSAITLRFRRLRRVTFASKRSPEGHQGKKKHLRKTRKCLIFCVDQPGLEPGTSRL